MYLVICSKKTFDPVSDVRFVFKQFDTNATSFIMYY